MNDKNKWYNREFTEQFVNSEPKKLVFESRLPKYSKKRTRSLALGIEFDLCMSEVNYSSTNQTSFEISIDDVLGTGYNLSMPTTTKNTSREIKSLDFENPAFCKNEEVKNEASTEKNRIKVLKTPIGKMKKGVEIRPSSIKKALINQYLSRDNKVKKNLENKTEEKPRVITPILSLKSTKPLPEKVPEKNIETRNKKTSSGKIPCEYLKAPVKSVSKNISHKQNEVFSFPEKLLNQLDVPKPVQANPIKIKILPAEIANENVFENFNISPLLTQKSDEHSSFTITSEVNSNYSLSSSENYIDSHETRPKLANFFQETGKDLEKNTQTESKFEKMEELMSLVSNQDFINSLKMIGKFAKFLEKNLTN